MAIQTSDPTLKSYLCVAWCFLRGLLRLWEAEAASARLMCALLDFHVARPHSVDKGTGPVVRHLAQIPRSSYDAFVYVTNLSHLVYATTLLDTFLTDTTLFLFLLIPQSIGKNKQVPLQTLIEASSRNQAITQAAIARTREIGYLPFTGRIQFLRDTFGLEIAICAEIAEAIVHFPSVRNTTVHDQGIFTMRLSDDSQVICSQKACPRHPTPVSVDDLHMAIKAYEGVAHAIARSVFTQVLKQQEHPAVQDLLHGFGGHP